MSKKNTSLPGSRTIRNVPAIPVPLVGQMPSHQHNDITPRRCPALDLGVQHDPDFPPLSPDQVQSTPTMSDSIKTPMAGCAAFQKR